MKKKIYIVDSTGGKFSSLLEKAWLSPGHEVKRFHCFHIPFYDWADVVYFDFVDSNAKWLTQHKDKYTYDPKKVHVARCVDIDAYANHPGGVDWKMFDGLIFISEHIQQWCNERFEGLKDVEQYIVRCGVDTDKFKILEGTRGGINIGWVGRLWVGKNFAGALDILYEVRKQFPRARLHVRGDGAHPNWWEEYYKHKIKVMGLEDNVIFYDFIKDLPGWYNKMNYVLVTSFKEAFSYAAGEAAACGVMPLILNSPEMNKLWPKSWLYNTPCEAVKRLFSTAYDAQGVRQYVLDNYPLSKHVKETSKICKIPLNL